MSATKALRAPSKIASTLDWKKASGAILALDIGADKIGLAIASHPAYGDEPLPLQAVPMHLETKNSKKVLSSSVTEQLNDIIKKHNVSCFVVSWPMQKEGRCGWSCGKALHALDQLVDSNVITAKKPYSLWDSNHVQMREDEWGRNPLFGEPRTDGVTVHKASEEQYRHESSSQVAATVMDDFLRAQYPEIFAEREQKQEQPAVVQPNEEVSIEFLDSYEETGAYVTMSA